MKHSSHISDFQTQQVSVGKRNEQFEPGAKYAWSMFWSHINYRLYVFPLKHLDFVCKNSLHNGKYDRTFTLNP